MSVATVHVLHGIDIAGTFLSQLQDVTPTANVEDLVGYAAGHPDPLFTGTRSVKPDVRFGTTQIKTLLDACGADFLADLSGGNTDLYYKKVTNLGEREAAASLVHTRMRMATGILYWEEISVEHQQDAVMRARIVPIYNGSVAPLIPAGSLALVGTPAVTSFFTLGPVVINTVALPAVKSWRLALSNTAMEESADGELYTTFSAIQRLQPVLEVRSLEIGAWASFGLDGTAISALTFALRKKDPDGGNVANGTAEHIVFAGSGGKVNLLNSEGGAADDKTATMLRIPLRAASASVRPVSFNSASAIS